MNDESKKIRDELLQAHNHVSAVISMFLWKETPEDLMKAEGLKCLCKLIDFASMYLIYNDVDFEHTEDKQNGR